MTEERTQEHRRARLQALLDAPEFGGNKAKLGAALGLKSGAMVWQMLDGRRPVSEKTVVKIETMAGGRYRGWFGATELPKMSLAAAPAALDPPLQQALDDLRDLESLDPEARERVLQDLHNLADRARAIARRATERAQVPAVAARKSARAKSALTLTLGDGNPDQGALQLTILPDPFTAAPDERELALYHRIAKDKERHPK